MSLSRSAQAVLEAIGVTPHLDLVARGIAAVTLRAVADQVVPPDPCGDDCCITQCEQIRAELLAIADELDG